MARQGSKKVTSPTTQTDDGPTVGVSGTINEEIPMVRNRKRVRPPEHGLDEETGKPVKVSTSSFHITVNTNQRYGSKSAIIADMRPLYETLRDVWGDTSNVKQIIDIMKEGDEFESVIGDVSSDIGVEYSPVAGLHAHCLMTITHKSKVRIQLDNLRGLLDKKMPHLAKKAPYVHVRFVPDQKSAVMNYIYKTVNNAYLKMKEGMNFNSPMTCKCDCKIADMSQFFSE